MHGLADPQLLRPPTERSCTPTHHSGEHKATPSGITVSGLGLSLLSRRAGGSTHYAIIHHSNLKVI